MHPFNRRWHRRISIFIALPFFITLTTGILLITRSINPWLTPVESATHAELMLSFPQILEAVKNVPEANIHAWADIASIQAQPKTGVIRVRTKDRWEIALDGASGAIVGSGPHKVGMLMAWHEGAYFGDIVRYGIFLPSALAVLFLLISGVVIYAQTWRAKRRARF